jgi:hypothetical protein
MSKNLIGGKLNHNLRCAPDVDYTDGSCMTTEQLKFLAYVYNKAVEKKKMTGLPIKLVNNKSFLLDELDNRLKDCKGNHLCWIKHKFMKGYENLDLEEVFKPDGTDGRIDWLSTENIDNVMFQMERKFPDYFFYGAVPIDWHSINYNGLAKIDFADIMVNGAKLKNERMKEYSLQQFYLNNFLLINAISIFIEATDKTNFIEKNKKYLKKLSNSREFDIFMVAIKELDKFKKILEQFNDQFKSPKYDEELIKFIKGKFKDFVNDIYNEVKEIVEKKYPIKRIAIVPNMDEHWKGGSHWVAIFANLENGNMYFYDSYGTRPETRLREFFKLVAEWKYENDKNKKLNIPEKEYLTKDNKNKNEIEQIYDIRYSAIRSQYKYSECGVYSISFILRLLHGTSFDKIISQAVPDDLVNTCREFNFNNQDITNQENFTIRESKSKGGLVIKKVINNSGVCM